MSLTTACCLPYSSRWRCSTRVRRHRAPSRSPTSRAGAKRWLYRAGEELMAGEKFERAAEEFIKAIDEGPLFTLAHYGLGQAYMNLRRYPDAVKAFKDASTPRDRSSQ